MSPCNQKENAVHHHGSSGKAASKAREALKENTALNVVSRENANKCDDEAVGLIKPKCLHKSLLVTPRVNQASREDSPDSASSEMALSRPGSRSWKPELTIPRSPKLHTQARSRSTSLARSEDGCQSRRSAWQHRFPREQRAIQSHFDRVAPAGLLVTPNRSRREDSVDSISSDMALSVPCSSVRSRIGRSCDSRLSQRSSSRNRLSTADIEELRVDFKRQEVKDLMALNKTAYQKAIRCPTSARRHSRELTVPREFNLSCPVTPARSIASDDMSNSEEKPWLRSLRSRSAAQSATRSWKPELTVPCAPNLRARGRSRSASVPRSESGRSSNRSTSRHRFPREQRAIEHHFHRVAAAESIRKGEMMVTPRTNRSRRDGSVDSMGSDMALSVPCSSVRSRMDRSCDSRFSQRSSSTRHLSSSVRSHMSRSCDSRLSQRSSSRRQLSTVEIEQLRIAFKQQEVKDLMALNVKTWQAAQRCPVLPTSIPRHQTVPKEFNLSCSSTPARSFAADESSDCGEKPWEQSLRALSRAPSASRSWKPELTAPVSPRLRTPARSRSTSLARSDNERCSQRTMSRHRFPREQIAIEQHFDRAAAGESMRKTKDDVQSKRDLRGSTTEVEEPAPGTDLDEWVKAAGTPLERAQRARFVAKLKENQKFVDKDAKVKVFGRCASRGRSRNAIR